MATDDQIASTYDYMDRIWRLSLGDYDDITAALFDGDYSKSLEQAQRDKHDYILRQLGLFQDGASSTSVAGGAVFENGEA